MLRKDARQHGDVDRLICLLADLMQKNLDFGVESKYQLINYLIIGILKRCH